MAKKIFEYHKARGSNYIARLQIAASHLVKINLQIIFDKVTKITTNFINPCFLSVIFWNSFFCPF